ncbi:MAG TPA: DUF1232 domain-containing protein [Longimicrobium sp.]|uniref:YkvA family protein n=1 Tax=Longimicrobium sp. TaxID=2029185 RepID=UPI002ED8F2AB
MSYSDDDQPRRGTAGRDDDLVGPRRGGRARAGVQDDGGSDDLVGPRRRSRFDMDDNQGEERPRRGGRVRTGVQAAQSLPTLVRDIPNFIRLAGGLALDRRVNAADKAIVAASIAYFFSPVDLIPEAILPVIGSVEDVYLLMLALARLVHNTDTDVLLDHWHGDPDSLEQALTALDNVSAMIPGPLRMLLGAGR